MLMTPRLCRLLSGCYVLLFPFALPTGLPLLKFPLSLLALIESQYVRPDAAGNGFYLMLGDIGVIYKFLSPAQIIPPFTDL